MGNAEQNRNSIVTNLLNATLASIKAVIPVEPQINKPQLLEEQCHLNFGVLVGITGDMNGKLVFTGETETFSSISQVLYQMPLEGEMLLSFSGELGNMIAGGMATQLTAGDANSVMITSPTILQGNTKLSGYKQALKLGVLFKDIGQLDTYLLID